MSSDVERTLPHNLEAERSVLGAILVNAAVYSLAAATVRVDDFFRESHRKIFSAIQRLVDSGTTVDLLTLKDELSKAGDLDEIGGPAYVASLADGVPKSTNVEHYARIVVEKSLLRQTIYAANRIMASAYDADLDAAMVVDDGVQQLLALAKPAAGGAVSIGDAMRTWLAEVEGTRTRGFATGLTDLDSMLLGGLHPRELVMIAGRPSMGKSTLMMNLAERIAHEVPVAIFTLEMAATALVEGTLARHAQVDAHRIRAKILTQHDYARLSHAMETVHGLRLYLIERAAALSQIQAWCRRLHEQLGVRVFGVDYIQRIGNPQARDRRLEIDQISRSFQRLAFDLDSVFIVLSQLTRASEHRTDKRPQMSDLKESGALEADADTIILIYRDDAYNRDPDNADAGIAELIVAKQRYGPVGVARVAFLREQLRFANLAMG